MSTIVEKVDSSVIGGAYFSWVISHNTRVGKEFVQKISTDVSNDDGLLKFEWVDGKKMDLNVFTLIYDIEVLNLNPRWKLVYNGNVQNTSIMKRMIKPELMYKKTLDLHVPDLEDMIRAIQWSLQKHIIPSCFETEISTVNFSDVVDVKCLAPRNFSGSDVDNPATKLILRSEYVNTFIVENDGNSPRSGDDLKKYYKNVWLPLTPEETALHNLLVASFETCHIGYDKAISLCYEIRLFDKAVVYVERMSRSLSEHNPHSVRIGRIMNSRYFREIYTLTRALAVHADQGISRELKIRLRGDDPERQYSNVCDGLSLNLSSTSPLTAIVRSLDPTSVASVAITLAKVYTNPNLYIVSMLNATMESNFSISTLYGIFIFQSLFISSVVSAETKMYFNNHIARFIVEVILPQNIIPQLPDNAQINNCSINDWYNMTDRLVLIYGRYGILPSNVQTFLNMYYGVETSGLMSENVLVGDNSLNLPYASHRLPGDLIHLNLWQQGTPDLSGRALIRPVLPYTYTEICNWTGRELNNVMASFSEMIANSNNMLKNIIMRFKAIACDGARRLQGIFNLLLERSYVVATTPFSDDVLRTDVSHHSKIMLPIEVSELISLLVYPSVPTETTPIFQPPSNEFDYALQTTLPFLRYIMDRISQSMGQYRRSVSPQQLFQYAIDAIGKITKLSPNLIKALTIDSVTRANLFDLIRKMDVTLDTRVLLNMTDTYYQLMASTRQRRGLREYFYLALQPSFLNLCIERLDNVFHTNGVPSDDVVVYAAETMTTNDLIKLLCTENPLYVSGHDVNGSRDGIDIIKTRLGEPFNAFDHAVNRKDIRVIRINHPCIVTYSITHMHGKLQKPHMTKFIGNDEMIEKLSRGHPIDLNIEIQLYHGDYLHLKASQYNKYYMNTDLVMTADLFPMPYDFLGVTDYMSTCKSQLSMRKDPIKIFNPEFGITSTGLLRTE